MMLSSNNQHISHEVSFYQERIRQAQLAFNLCAVFVAASACITIVGIILLLSGWLSVGAYTTIAGLTATAVGGQCVRLSREANDRLDRIIQDLIQELKKHK